MKVTTTILPGLIKQTIKAGLTAMVHGSPAIGKSDIMHQVAKSFNLELIDVRLSQCDPVDLNGFPMLDTKNDIARYVPMDIFPLESTPLPEGKNGWLLFLDEINSAPGAVTAAAYKLILDRVVGQHPLHSNVAMAAAGNLITDRAIVNKMPTAMQSRMLHFEVEPDLEGWLGWAAKSGIDHRIMSYLSFKPNNLYMFDPKHNGYTYPSPRTWAFLSKLLEPYPNDVPSSAIPLLASAVDEGAAREFYSYCQIFKDLVTVDQIMQDPTGTIIPREPATQYALSGSIGQQMNGANVAPLLQYVTRMAIEFQILTVQSAYSRDPAILSNPALVDWLHQNATDLFGDI